MKLSILYDTDTKEIEAYAEENGEKKKLGDVSSVILSKTGFSIWQRDKLVAANKDLDYPDPQRAAAILDRFTLPDPKAPIEPAAGYVFQRKLAAPEPAPDDDRVTQDILAHFGVKAASEKPVKQALAHPDKTRQEIQRYFAALESGED